MDKQEVGTELRRQHEQAELVSVDAHARIREAEQLVAARELVSALENVVDSRLRPVSDEVRLELFDALASEATRAREQMARGAEDERAAIEERLTALIDDRVRAAASGLADQNAKLSDQLGHRFQSALEERFAAEAERFSAQLEAKVREQADALRSELESWETERIEHIRSLAEEQSEAVAERLRRETERARTDAAAELGKHLDQSQKDVKRQRGKLEDRVSGRIGKRIEGAVERQVRAAVTELAEEQRRQRSRDLEALGNALREEFESRLQELEQRSQASPPRRW